MLLGLSLAMIIAAPAGALAQSPACHAEAARVPYEAGIRSMREGRYQEAIADFARADQLCPDPRAIFKQCKCQEFLLASAERCAAAARCYEEYFAACQGRSCPDEQTARRRHTHLLGELCGRVRVTSDPDGAALSADGSHDGETPRELLLRAREHTFAASSPGRQPARKTVHIRGGANPDVTLQLPEPPKAATIVDPDDTTKPRPMSTLALAGWITLGAGVATAATGTIFTAKAYSAADDFDSAGTRDQQSRASSAIDDNSTRAAVLYGLGGAAALTGAALIVVDLVTGSGGEESGVVISPIAGGFSLAF